MENFTNLTNATVPSLVDRASDVALSGMSIVPLVLSRMWDLASAPFHHQEMLWILFPLVVTLIVLEFYFDRHGDEELGWAAAVANSLILFIVAIDLVKHSFHQAPPFEVLAQVFLAIFTDAELPMAPQVLILIAFIGLMGIAVTLINYYHLLPKKLAFEVSGHPPVNYLAYFAIAIVYTADTPDAIPLDIPTLVAAGLLYVILLVIFFTLKRWFRRMVHGSGRTRWG